MTNPQQHLALPVNRWTYRVYGSAFNTINACFVSLIATGNVFGLMNFLTMSVVLDAVLYVLRRRENRFRNVVKTTYTNWATIWAAITLCIVVLSGIIILLNRQYFVVVPDDLPSSFLPIVLHVNEAYPSSVVFWLGVCCIIFVFMQVASAIHMGNLVTSFEPYKAEAISNPILLVIPCVSLFIAFLVWWGAEPTEFSRSGRSLDFNDSTTAYYWHTLMIPILLLLQLLCAAFADYITRRSNT